MNDEYEKVEMQDNNPPEEKPKRGRKKAAETEPPEEQKEPEKQDDPELTMQEEPDLVVQEAPKDEPKTPEKNESGDRKSFYGLNFNELDRGLSPEQLSEWSAIYASYRSKSILSGTVIGVDQHTFSLRNSETGEIEKKTMYSAIVIEYRVKVLIPEAEMWMPDETRPEYVLRNMVGSKIDYVIMDVDRVGECAIASRRIALSSRRHYFSTAKNLHQEDELLECHILAVGPKRCLVECNGYDIGLTQRDLSYTAIPDLREKYHPGQKLPCKLKSYDKEKGQLVISVKEVNPNPFIGAELRHPVGSRRQATISGKYAGGVFCTLPDETVCLCLYSSQHADSSFRIGDNVIISIRQYDYVRKLIYGRIMAKW